MRGNLTWGLGVAVSTSLLGGLVLIGCHPAPAAYFQKMRSPNPLDRAEGIRAAERAGDPRAVQELVALLDDGDPAVRMFAQVALRELTGDDFGYQFYAEAAARRAAIERWQQALREGRVAVHRGAARRDIAATRPQTEPDP